MCAHSNSQANKIRDEQGNMGQFIIHGREYIESAHVARFVKLSCEVTRAQNRSAIKNVSAYLIKVFESVPHGLEITPLVVFDTVLLEQCLHHW